MRCGALLGADTSGTEWLWAPFGCVCTDRSGRGWHEGGVRPGAWSYGQPVVGPSAYGVPPPPPRATVAPAYLVLQRAYLDALP